MIGTPKSTHWLPNFIPDKLLLQEMAYQTCINGVYTSFMKEKKVPCPPFPFSTKMCKIENAKKEKYEVNVLYSFNFSEVNFWRHDPKGFLKEYLKQLNITWLYSHEYFVLRELSQQGVLIKSKIPTPQQIDKIDKEVERKKDESEKNKAINEWHTNASSSSISLYYIDFENEDIACASSRTPSPIRKITPPLEQGEEIDSSHATIKSLLEKHFSNNSLVLEQEGPSSYNI